jgi:hypothetical protein
MPRLPTHKQWRHDESRLIHLSTSDGTRSTDGSKYNINIGSNALFNKNISRLFPVHLFCPNIFPNVKAPYNVITLASGGPAIPVTVPPGQYTATGLAATINALAFPTFPWMTFTVDASGYFVLNNAHATFLTSVSLVGGIRNVIGPPNTGNTYTATALSSVTFDNLPNLGGEKLIHIKSERLGIQNMLHSRPNVSKVADIAFTVSLHDTEYGGTACYEPGDNVMSDIEFTWDQHIDVVDLQILDAELNPLSLPPNYSIDLLLKGYHQD